jgi:predicted negative regulator of RcsB-dependent stress response
MTKKAVKQQIKKPDILLKTIASVYGFVRSNLRTCILGLFACVIVASAVYGYVLYENRKNDQAQYLLHNAMKTYEAYMVAGNEEDLKKAEDAFKNILAQKQGKTYKIARLYLARIQYLYGKKDEAVRLYRDVLKDSPDSLLKTLAEKAIIEIEKK